jgi:hypothetical protein
MADPRTPYLDLTKPIVNDEAGEDLWGDKLNRNFDLIDSFAASVQVNEAPDDGVPYARQSLNWTPTIEKATFDTVTGDMQEAIIQNATDIDNLEVVVAGKAPMIHGHVIPDVTGLEEALASKEPVITAGTSAQFWRGDKTWHPISDINGAYEPKITVGLTTQYWRGDKTWQILDKAAVGLGNVDNTSDASKPMSGPTKTYVDSNPGEAPNDGSQYARQSAAWTKVTGGAYVATTPPAATDNSFWWNNQSGVLAIRYNDGNSTAWVTCSTPGPPGPTGTPIIVSDTAPVGAPLTSLWWSSAQGGLYINYLDPSGPPAQWVMVNAAGMPEAPKTGLPFARKDGAWFDLTATLAAKADVTTVTPKADKTYVDSQDALKANLTGAAFTGVVTNTTEFRAAGAYGFRMTYGSYGSVWYQDGTNLYLMLTAANDQNGGFNSLRPMYVNVTNGNIQFATAATFSNAIVVGSSTHGTDGNIYMPIYGDWLSNVIGGKAPIGGVGGAFAVGGTLTVTGQGQFLGSNPLYSNWAGANTVTSTANCYINSFGTFQRTTSSDRYKTAIEPLSDEWADKVMQLEPIYYRPTGTSDPVGYTRYGFAAEQCYAVDPRFSTCEPAPITGYDEASQPIYGEDKLDVIAFDLNAIVAALQQVIKRQDARIAALEAASGV